MTALGKLFRTTAFQLALAFLVLSAIGAGLVLGAVAWQVQAVVDEEMSAHHRGGSRPALPSNTRKAASASSAW